MTSLMYKINREKWVYNTLRVKRSKSYKITKQRLDSRNTVHCFLSKKIGKAVFDHVLNPFLLQSSNEISYKKKVLLCELKYEYGLDMYLTSGTLVMLHKCNYTNARRLQEAVSVYFKHHFTHQIGGYHSYYGIDGFVFTNLIFKRKELFCVHDDGFHVKYEVDMIFTVSNYGKNFENNKWFETFLSRLPFLWLWKFQDTRGFNGMWTIGFQKCYFSKPAEINRVRRIDFIA